MSERPDLPPAGTDVAARGTTRRWFFAAAAVAVLGGGGGVAAQFLRHDTRTAPRPRPPRDVVAALAAEQALIRDLDATTGGDFAARRAITQVRADHAAHAQALRGLLAGYPEAAPSAAATGTARTLAQLQAVEHQAADQAATRASTARGELAALLASIAACEATHAQLLR